ncbi:phage tail protein [Pedobacter sp. L105]|uniref:phage tail protein n=1 Tax=Pedobacter sp. L105 TaxID=1641871 RepID=UPI00131EBC72|nr:hypothetical protein [Pedobacter sp. L105]
MINSLIIYRAGAVLTSIDIDENTVYNEKIPGTKLITCPVTAQTALSIQQGDYITWKSENYVIHILPDFDKSNDSNTKKYNITFEAEFYQFLDEFVISSTGLKDFPYYGNAASQLQLIVNNANRDSSGWSVGTVDPTVAQIVNYSWTYCREALDIVAEAFGLEYQFTGRVVSMVATVGRDTTVNIQMGRGKGLQGISRKPDTSKNIINRVYAIGGTRNIDSTYRDGLQKNLIIEGEYIQTPGVTAKTESVKEAKYSNDLIFPHYKGVVTSRTVVSAADGSVSYVTITDKAIDFDVMAYLQSGVNATVGFLTGELTGIEFQVAGFDFATKIVTLINNTDANGYITPNTLNLPAVGDSFTFYDIRMPDAYVTKAEADLLAAATVYLNENKSQILVFTVKTDEKYLRDNLISIKCGDRITVTDSDLNLANQILRFTEISYPLVNEYAITGVIGNQITYDKIVKLFADVDKSTDQIQNISLSNIKSARQNSINLNNLAGRVFDPDGSLAEGAATLFAAMTKVGFDSQNFGLIDVVISTNIAGNENSLSISAGQLVHRIYKIDGVGYDWIMTAKSITGLTPAKYYYVYAKCSTTTLTGTWEISETPVTVGSFAGFWCFNLGQLFEVNTDGYRNFEFTKGITYTVGNTITSGRLQDITKQNYFDVETAQFNLGAPGASGMDYGVTTPKTLTLRGALMQSGSGIVSPLPAYRGDYDAGSTYYKGDTVLYNGSQWIFINAVATAGQTPLAGIYWAVYASQGNGSIGVSAAFTQFRYQKNGSSTVAPALTVTDVNPSLWTLAQPTLGTGEYLWMTSAIKNPQDGARNYFSKNSVLTLTNVGSAAHNGTTNNGITIIGQSGGGGNIRIQNVINSNGLWTISFIASANQRSSIPIDICNGTPQYVLVAASNVENTYSLTFNVTTYLNGGDTTFQFVDFGGIENKSYVIRNLKIQKGNVADQWTPAPEDIEYQDQSTLVGTWGVPVRTSGTSGVQGAYLTNSGKWLATTVYVGTAIRIQAVQYPSNNLWYTTRTDAGNIPAGTLPTNTAYYNPFGAQFDSVATGLLLANAITAENLTVRNVKTAEAGVKHIEINGVDNNLKVLNAAGAVLALLDDDSAYETVRSSDIPPVQFSDGTYQSDYLYRRVGANGVLMYYYAVNGPGMSIGISPTDANGFSSVGRKEIYTNGRLRVSNADETNETVIDKTGINTTGTMSVTGQTTLAGPIALANGLVPFTGYELVSSSGPQTRKYINGFYIGIGDGNSW